jgi:hypothetical protein
MRILGLITLLGFLLSAPALADQRTSLVLAGNGNAAAAGLSYSFTAPKSAISFGPVAEVGYFPAQHVYHAQVGVLAAINFGAVSVGVGEVYVINHSALVTPQYQTQGVLTIRL